MAHEMVFAGRGGRLARSLASPDADRLAEMQRATGIDDAWVLSTLLARDIGPERVKAFALLPLAAVAWADGVVEPAEREAALDAAYRYDVGPGGLALVESWLASPPDEDLHDLWRAYAGAVVSAMEWPQRDAWRAAVLDGASRVAAATGGFLGAPVSPAEACVLRATEAAMH